MKSLVIITLSLMAVIHFVSGKSCSEGLTRSWREYSNSIITDGNPRDLGALNKADCQSECIADPSCTAYTLNNGCFLHSIASELVMHVTRAGGTAVIMECRNVTVIAPGTPGPSQTPSPPTPAPTTSPTTSQTTPTIDDTTTTTAQPTTTTAQPTTTTAQPTTQPTTTEVDPSNTTTDESTTSPATTTSQATTEFCQDTQWYIHPTLSYVDVTPVTSDASDDAVTVPECQTACMQYPGAACRAVTFSTSAELPCRLYNTSTQVMAVRLQIEEAVTLQERGCVGQNSKSDSSVTWDPSGVTYQMSQTLWGVPSIEECQQFCDERSSFYCLAISYNFTSERCAMSDGTLGPSDESWYIKHLNVNRGNDPYTVSNDVLSIHPVYAVLIGLGTIIFLLILLIICTICLAGKRTKSASFAY